MEFNENSNLSNHQLDLQIIKNSKKHCKLVTSLAADLAESPYYSIAKYFKEISQTDLQSLYALVEAYHKEDEVATEDLLLFLLLFLYAEGLQVNDQLELEQYMSVMCIIITAVDLSRQGLVRIYWENLTLGLDYGDRPVFERIV